MSQRTGVTRGDKARNQRVEEVRRLIQAVLAWGHRVSRGHPRIPDGPGSPFSTACRIRGSRSD
jgi:hypothetical protein